MKTPVRFLSIMVGLLLLAPAAARAAEKAADIVYLKGKAVIERQKQSLNAELKSPLLETDNVVTRERSRAKMLFRDDSIVTLGSKSRLVIKKYLYNPATKRSESVYELADGKLKAVVAGGSFRVTTPTAFAAARGTVFVVWYDPATGTTGIGVIEGTVSFGNTEGGPGLTLGPGTMSTITGSGQPSSPQPFSGAGGFISELFETPGPDLVLPEERLEQIRLDLVEKAGSVAAPPVDLQPAAAASTTTSVRITVQFP